MKSTVVKNRENLVFEPEDELYRLLSNLVEDAKEEGFFQVD